MEKDNITEFKNWDGVTKWILGISILLILFSFFAPLIFTSNYLFERLDFTETGQIGDTIGGILNPFIALAGVLLTFLAFYMQIKANQIQISQFKESIKKDKEKRSLIERTDYYNKLRLLEVDLKTIESDIQQKAKNIEDYYESEKNSPFSTNILKRSPTKKYSRILEIDRLSIFNGFSLIFDSKDDLIKNFSNLYNILDFLPELFEDIYNKYDYHSKDIYTKKMDIRSSLIELMNKLSGLINEYLKENNKNDYLLFPASSLANETILKYYKIIEESFNQSGDFVKETDFNIIDDEVLKFFLKETFKIRRNIESYDTRLDPIIEQISDLRKGLHLIRETSQIFASNIQSQHELLINDSKANISYNTIMINIRKKIELALSQKQ